MFLSYLAGKFALEGYFKKIVVRSIKCYFLEKECECRCATECKKEKELMLRMKGQKRSCQDLMKEEDFREPNPYNLKYGTDWCMRPNSNLDIVMKRESRQFIKSINLKRRCEVGVTYIVPLFLNFTLSCPRTVFILHPVKNQS